MSPMSNPDFLRRVAESTARQEAWEAEHLTEETCSVCRDPKTEEICHGEGCCSDPSPDGEVHACRGWSGMCCSCGHDYAMGQI